MYQTIVQIKLCMDLSYTQAAVPLAGSIFKILPTRGTRSQKTEKIQLWSDSSLA